MNIIKYSGFSVQDSAFGIPHPGLNNTIIEANKNFVLFRKS